jgi:hypothetical protein
MKVKAGDIYTLVLAPATAAPLSSPAGVSAGPAGRLVVADNGNNTIREISGSVLPAPIKKHRHRA